ncbi:MAG TPA: ABC transporter permease [Gaiellaceae bacterium]|nr:ABC transporter permease [Gaiellaceae bacterium]
MAAPAEAQVPTPSLSRRMTAWYTGRRRGRSIAHTRLGKIGLPVLSVLIFGLLWQYVGAHTNPILFTTPVKVAQAFWALLKDGELWPAFYGALRDLGIGYGLAAVVGIVVGMAMGRSPVVERMLNPYVNFFQATPLIALVPLVVIWFGVNLQARVAITFILALWSIIINTSTGVKDTSPALLDVGRIYKLNALQVVGHVQLPNAVPHIFAGLRIALGKALIGVIIAQMEISITGLGGIVINYGNAFKTAYLLAGVVTASLVGVVAAVLLEVIRKRVFPWTEDEGGGGWKAAI